MLITKQPLVIVKPNFMKFKTSFIEKLGEIKFIRAKKLIKYASLCFIFFMTGVTLSFAQSITLNEKNGNLKEVLEKVRKQSNLDLIGDLKLLMNCGPVTIQVKDKKLSDVLTVLSRNQPVNIIVQNKTIIVQAKKNENLSQFSNQNLNANQLTVVGIVQDQDGKAIVGATLKSALSGRTLGSTQQFGSFSIKIDPNDEVIVSMIGYETYKFKITDTRDIRIRLTASSTVIEETVVTGYGTRRKETFTGASTTITRKELEKFNNNNIFSIIQNLDPAFKVEENNQYGSDPNRVPEITIRGTTSVGAYGLNAPLVIMDGFEVPVTRLYDLDVNRIESITLLKDASSTVLYGSRGGNGVIVIETRLPRAEGVSITYNLRPEVVVVDLSDYNLMNSKEKLEFEKLSGVYTAPYSSDKNYMHLAQANLDNIYAKRLVDIASGVDTYWLSQPVETNMSSSQSIRLEGGFGQMRFSLDGNYGIVKGIMKGSERKRIGGGLNIFYRIPNKITFRNTTSLVGSRGNNSGYGDFSVYTRLNPYYKIQDENGNLIERYAKGLDYFASTQYIYNPLYNASLPYIDFDNSLSITNNLDIEFFILPELRVQLRGSLGKSINNSESYLSPRHTQFINTVNVNEKGSYSLNNGESMNYAGTSILTYAKVFAEKHSVSGNAVFELNHDRGIGGGTYLTGFADDRYISPSLAFDYAPNTKYSYTNVPLRRVGFMGSASYIFDERFYTDMSYRIDGSSRYGRNKRYGNFWATGIGYNMHKESFLKDNKVLSLLRMYLNTGVSGTDNLDAKVTNTYYQIGFQSMYNNQTGFAYNSEGNPDLRWPQIKSYSIGLSSGFFDNRIALRLEAYRRITHDMASQITVAPSVGLAGNVYTENLGKVKNEGYEMQLDVKPYENADKTFNLILRLQGAYNRSKLSEISQELRELNDKTFRTQSEGYQAPGAALIPQTVYYQEGESLSNIKGVRSLGIDPATGREIYLKNDNTLTYIWDPADMQIIGNKEPKIFGNISGFINYKNLSLEAYFNYTVGGQMYNQTLVNKIENVDVWENADKRVLYERWKEPGDETFYKGISDMSRTQLTSRFVQKENYLRLGSLNLNYTVSPRLISKFKLQRVRLNFSMNDVFRLSTVRMERGTSYPFSRTYNFGLLVQY